MRNKIIATFALCLFAPQLGYSDKKVPTPEELLLAYKVELTATGLIEALRRPEPVVREKAAILLGRREEKAAATTLKFLLGDEYVPARLAAAGALMQLGDDSGMAILEASLSEGDDRSKIQAAGIFAILGRIRGYETLSRIAAESESEWDRLLAVRTLPGFSKMAQDQVISDLIRALRTDPEANVRRGAAGELLNFSGDNVRQAMETAVAKDSDSVVRGLAQSYLDRIHK